MPGSFAVHIGGGAYLDAEGNLVFGPPDQAQIYEAPQGFHIETDKIKDTFKSLSDLLPKDDEAKANWKKWGVPADLVDFLASIAGVASIIATAIAVYAWAIGVLLTLMSLMTDDEGLSPELARALNGIKSQLQGMEQIQRADSIIGKYAEFDGRINSMKTLLTRLEVEKPGPAVRAQIFGEMRTLLSGLDVPLSNLQNQEWAATYDPDNYKGRAFASTLLYTQRPNGSLEPVPMQAPNVTHFDYRLGIPLLLYGATAYTALVQVAMPWFRSAGLYAGQLRATAAAIDRFVLRMQNESLARTNYTAQTVLQQQVWPVFEIPTSGPRSALTHEEYAVGAFDLVRYNDGFLWDRFGSQFQAGLNTGERGLFNYRWYNPESDLEKVAAAANEQARQQYANLQVASGMLHLIKTAAWLRFLSTPPQESQTVSGGVVDSRAFYDEQADTATSSYIFPIGVIEHPATLKRYQARSRARMTTQEPGYVPAFTYRVVLRTINSLYSKEAWANREYVGDVWQADYEAVQSDPRLKRLRTRFSQGLILSETVLYEGPSPAEAVNAGGEKMVRAATFDWYVPVVSPWSRYSAGTALSVENLSAHYRRPGGSGKAVTWGAISPYLLTAHGSESVPVQPFRDQKPSLLNTVDDVLDLGEMVSLADVALTLGERRHVALEEVWLKWQLVWQGDKLEVRLFGRPEDRPFQVQVVVEERVFSGEALPEHLGDILGNNALVEHIHTPFTAELANQMLLVPESFFHEERRALEQGEQMWHDFLRRFSEQAQVGPGEPIEHLQHAIQTMASMSLSTATLAAAMEERVAFATEQAPELWGEVAGRQAS